MSQFDDKVLIVTGAGIGIGFEIARSFAKAGAMVGLNDINPEVVNKAVEKINAEGGKCLGLPGDASDYKVVNNIVNETVKHFGKVDIAIANAGITLFDNFLDYAPESLSKVLKLNLEGSFFLLQAAAKHMVKRKSGGKLMVMSSVTGHQAHEKLAAYGMTKAGLEMLAKSLVLELSPYGITVNAIAPGATNTERTLQDDDYQSVWSKLTPSGRPSNVEDIAGVAMFLASEAANQITGQTIIVDGGWTSVSPGPETVR